MFKAIQYLSLLVHLDEMPDLEDEPANGLGVLDFHRVADSSKAQAAKCQRLLLVEPDAASKLRDFQRLHDSRLSSRCASLASRGPYEILEFFADNKNNTVVLYYKDGYYLLREDADKVTPLKAITDPALLNKLKEYRKN